MINTSGNGQMRLVYWILIQKPDGHRIIESYDIVFPPDNCVEIDLCDSHTITQLLKRNVEGALFNIR